jgi:hypothetical protein
VGDERRDGSRSEDYRVARITIAITLSLVIAVLTVGDLVVPGEQVSFPTLALLGVMVLTLVGIEARDLMRGK